MDAAALILVEGVSDQAAVEALAERQGRDLAAESVAVVPIGGAQAIGRVLRGLDDQVRLAGLCDAGEEHAFQRALGIDGRAELERRNFFVCEADLEDELIRALGAERVQAIVDTQGELGPFRTLQKQPEWRGRPVEDQLRRWLGSGSTRKIRYARLMVEALEPKRAARPLRLVLASV
jgi:hypothetical protein